MLTDGTIYLHDINQMLSEKGKPCLSIIIPTVRYSRERQQNPELIEKAIDRAKTLLQNTAWPKDQVSSLMSRLDLFISGIDFLHLEEGLALFISPAIYKVYHLPFEVKEKVMLDSNFELRDLLYYNQYLQPYCLLAISRNRVRLFKGCAKELKEVINNDFPMKHIEEYEYARPSVGSPSSPALKAFERDKSTIEETRSFDFYKRADGKLQRYLKNDMRLFIAGVQESLANFQNVTRHSRNIKGRIEGNFDYDAIHLLAKAAWGMVRDAVRNDLNEELSDVEEFQGKHLVTTGIAEVWKAAFEGKGLKLMVEKSYSVTGYLNETSPAHLFLNPPVPPYTIVHDAVDNIIEAVIMKGGEVLIFEEGELNAFGNILMTLRY